MNWTLKHKPEPDGVFGTMFDENGQQIAVTLEHSFNGVPKVAAGTYTCERHAPNRLPYETFELQNVPDFQGKPVTGILIHIGNYNSDSDGCILVGSHRNGEMIMDSKITFAKIMDLLKDVDSFLLTVEDV
jgi:hypothetical protein